MCYILFNWKKMNELERNSKKYVISKFSFLIQKEYKVKYYHRNGEETFDFLKNNTHIYIFNEPNYVDCTFSNDKTPETNIKTIVGESFMKQFSYLTNIEKIDYLASLVEKNLYLMEADK